MQNRLLAIIRSDIFCILLMIAVSLFFVAVPLIVTGMALQLNSPSVVAEGKKLGEVPIHPTTEDENSTKPKAVPPSAI